MDRTPMDSAALGRIDLAREPDFPLGGYWVRPALRRVDDKTGGQRVLQRRVMQVLVALATTTSEVVSRQELVQRCWNGLSVSQDAVERCIAQLRALAAACDDPPFTITTIPGVGFRFEATRTQRSSELPRLPTHRPRLAVLPFASLSPDPEQSYFTEGLVGEIVNSLSRFITFEVISAGAGLFVDGRHVTPREAARELGVAYLLDGSVRRDGDRIRVNLRLTDAQTSRTLWTDRVDDAAGDVFAIQDGVADRVAGALEPVVEDIGFAATAHRVSTDLNSFDLLLRSLEIFRRPGQGPMLQAIALLEQAIAQDPEYAVALGHSVVCHRQVVDHQWSDDVEMFRRRGLEYAERALIVAPRDARVVAHVAAGLSGLEDRMDRSLALAEEAIRFNPSSAFAWLISGSLQLRAGQPDVAGAHLERSLRLDPISSRSGFSRMYLASARFQQRRLDEALALFQTTTHRLPLSHVILASLHGHRGEFDAARRELGAFESLEAGPLEKFIRIWFPADPYRALLIEGLSGAFGRGSLRLVNAQTPRVVRPVGGGPGL